MPSTCPARSAVDRSNPGNEEQGERAVRTCVRSDGEEAAGRTVGVCARGKGEFIFFGGEEDKPVALVQHQFL